MSTYSSSFELSGENITTRITYNVSQDVMTNRSQVDVVGVEIKTSSSDRRTVWVTGSISVNNTVSANLILSNTVACAAALSSEYVGTASQGSGYSHSPVSVQHNNDGTASVSFSVSLNFNITSGSEYFGSVGGTSSASLTRIPRVSKLNAPSVDLGSTMTIGITRAVSTFTDTITYVCGTASGTIATKTNATSINWIPTVQFAAQAPSANYVTITLSVTTYNGNTVIGTESTNVRCNITDVVSPSINSMQIVDTSPNGHLSRFGQYIQGQSTINVNITYAGVQGSSVQEVTVKCGDAVKTVPVSGSSASIPMTVGGVGNVAVTATITDTRGATASRSTTIYVAKYDRPTVRIQSVNRCTESGTLKGDGEYARAVFSGTATNLHPPAGYYNNGVFYYVFYRERGTVDWTSVAASNIPSSEVYDLQSWYVIFAVDPDKDYECCVIVQDNFSNAQSVFLTIPVAFALMDFDRYNRSIGFGQRASTADTMHIGLDMDLHGNAIHNVAAPTSGSDAATKTYVDNSVGSAGAITKLDSGWSVRYLPNGYVEGWRSVELSDEITYSAPEYGGYVGGGRNYEYPVLFATPPYVRADVIGTDCVMFATTQEYGSSSNLVYTPTVFPAARYQIDSATFTIQLYFCGKTV